MGSNIQYDRARAFMAAAAAAGNLTLFKHMSLVIGSPHDHPEPYDTAMFSACDAGSTDIVAALLSMGAGLGDLAWAIRSAQAERHTTIVNILTAYETSPCRDVTLPS